MQKRVINNILCILMEDLKKLEEMIHLELQKDESQNLKTKRADANMVLYEMGTCIIAMRDSKYEINPAEVPVKRAGTFQIVLDRVRFMKQKVCDLQQDIDNISYFEELYGAFISILAFIESMERSKKMTYPILSTGQKNRVDNNFRLLKKYVKECQGQVAN